MIGFFFSVPWAFLQLRLSASTSFFSVADFSSSLPLTLTIRSLCRRRCLRGNTAGSAQYAAHSMGGRQIHYLFRDSFVQKVDKKENQNNSHPMWEESLSDKLVFTWGIWFVCVTAAWQIDP